jgi:hypothetical protein
MMGDLISRKAVRNLVQKIIEKETPVKNDASRLIDILVHEIDDLPQKEKAGQWIMHNSRALWVCTCCGDTNLVTSVYCPNCGARMEEEDE